MPADAATLARLRSRIAALERGGAHTQDGPAAAGARALAFGLDAIDGHLPGGGLAAGGVHEVIDGDGGGTGARTGGHSGDPLALGGALTGLAAVLAGRAGRRPVVWIAPRTTARESLYAPGLAAFGLDPARLIAVRVPTAGGAKTAADTALWALEEVLRSPVGALALAEVADLDLTASRRLQLAAEAGGGTGLLLRPKAGERAVLPPTASLTRWRVAAAASDPPAGAAVSRLPGRPRWTLELLRARGATPRRWLVEWNDERQGEGGQADGHAAGGLALVPPLRDRADRPDRGATGSAAHGAAPDRPLGRDGVFPLRRTG